jgi:hypothetical protein
VDPDASTALLRGPEPGHRESGVVRPEPGTLARGVWEAPPWAFYASAAVVLVAAVVYGAARVRLFRRRPHP